MTNKIRRILVTPGEPAGIGPDILIQIAQRQWDAEIIAVADTELLLSRAKQLHLPITLFPFDLEKNSPHQPGTLKIISVPTAVPVEAGKLNAKNAAYVVQCLEIATDYCLQKKADAWVTGPVQKNNINEGGIPFTGHTEFLRERCGVKETIMLFIVPPNLKVALVTTHIPLSAVPSAISKEKLISVMTLLHREMQSFFHIAHPRIVVCGLNPHAGEGGHLGREEIEIISPAITLLQTQGMTISGPFSADTIFTEKYVNNSDVILAMYHDQALPVVKSLGFNRAVNITLGLPILRTSVDHGTALDLAGTGQADSGSLAAAMECALDFKLSMGAAARL